MTLYIKALIAAVVFALGLTVGWAVNGWRGDAELARVQWQHSKTLLDISEKTAKTVRAVHSLEQTANTAIQLADKAATARISDVRQETDRLRACVRDGTCGVRIVTRTVREPGSSCAANPSTCSLGNAAVELDQDVQQRVLDLRESIELDREKLDYLRAYAESCWRAGSEAVR